MHYQVSRNGQVYGPYTLEDLQRYVTSGNVLPTDLAKSEDMPDWLPVSQVLSGNPFTPGAGATPASPFTTPLVDTTPQPTAADPFYQAPAAPGLANQYPDPPNLHWGIYLLLTVLSAFVPFIPLLFSKVFTLVQAAWLRKVQPDSNAIFFYVGLYCLLIVQTVLSFSLLGRMMMHLGNPPDPSIIRNSLGTVAMLGILGIVYLILLIVTRFVMSASLEKHFNGPEPIGLKLNPVMVFFFGGVYFQAEFNRINTMKQAARYNAPRY